ncbi:MAG: phosphoglucosamine mutase [Planctomycetales bacterium]|nr:phosphoglucosamine mutase [Planctomycetales bacterium]
MSEPIISVSGLRGTIGEQLTPLVAVRYIAALASTLPTAPSQPAKVVIGRDGRSSGRMLAQVVAATLSACGLDTIDLDIVSTPTVGVQVLQQGAVAGIQISASHNPKQYNGLKLFGSDGRVLPKTAGEKVLAAYRAGQTRWVGIDALGSPQALADPHTAHCEKVLATVAVDAIRARQFRVLLDSNHGAGSLLGRQLLTALGCQFTILGETPDGQFAHLPEPLADNLKSVSSAVKQGDFDIGFCQDPDADRLAVIDEKGHYIGEELTLALCLLQALAKQPGTVVTNCATSGLSKVIAAERGCKLLQSAVGEANVADLMIAEQAVFGGEGNGGPIDPQVGYVRDSFVGMARILDLMTSSRSRVSELVAGFPKLSIVKDKIELDTSRLPKLFDLLTAEIQDASPSRQDGLKLEWSDRWLLVRGSNTEPIVRFIAEAPSIAEAQALCDQARKLSAGL